MGRKALPPDQIRDEMKFAAPRAVLEALSREAEEEGVTRKKLAEQIIVAHVKKRARKLEREGEKPAMGAKVGGRRHRKIGRRRTA